MQQKQQKSGSKEKQKYRRPGERPDQQDGGGTTGKAYGVGKFHWDLYNLRGEKLRQRRISREQKMNPTQQKIGWKGSWQRKPKKLGLISIDALAERRIA